MAMTYTSLVAPKGTTGSIANWAGYSKLDIPAVLEEAQMLLYETLRVREMRTEWTFGIIAGQSAVTLPSRFLDPIGDIFDTTNGGIFHHQAEGPIADRRTYEAFSGAFGSNPFTTVSGSASVAVTLTAHRISQDSTITIAAASVVGGLTLNGTFPVISVTDANHFVIDVGSEATSAATGGGASATYTTDALITGMPTGWGLWNEQVKFDVAFDAPCSLKMLYYRRPLMLSATNLTNFLTDRYPKLLRVATQAAAADFMEDDTKYQKHVATLVTIAQSTGISDDLAYRGASFGTDTPHGR